MGIKADIILSPAMNHTNPLTVYFTAGMPNHYTVNPLTRQNISILEF